MAAQVEETVASTATLNQLAQQLREIVSIFTTEETPGAAPVVAATSRYAPNDRVLHAVGRAA